MLSIIIVNYYCSDLILNCLHSFLDNKSDLIYEIIIVDNSKDEPGKTLLQQAYPSVRWLDMGYNAGFARANNLGIKESKGNVVLLLNPDTLILDQAIDQCYRAFIQSDDVACGVQLINIDGSPQISGNFAMKGGLNYLLPLPYLGDFLKVLGESVKVKKPNILETKDKAEVDWINGAFLMVKKMAIEKAGLLDEDFFLYAEEAEWCSRLKKIGKLYIYGHLRVIHLQGETANDTFASSGKGYYNLYDKKGLQIMVSNFVRIRKQFGLFWFFMDLFMYSAEILIFLFIGILDNIFKLKNPFRHINQWFSYSKNVLKLWSLSWLIVRNKPHFYKVL